MKTAKTKVVKIKAWAVIGKHTGDLQWDIHLGDRPRRDEMWQPWIFPTKKLALKVMLRVSDPFKVVPCTISYIIPKKTK